MVEFFRSLLEQPITFFAIILIHTLGLALIAYDISTSNRKISNLMKATWFLTVTYTGMVAAAIYLIAGRTFSQADYVWRRTLRSITRSLSGAGLGIFTALIFAQGILSLNPIFTWLVSLMLGFYASYHLAVVPLIRRGVEKSHALKDVVYGRTASILLMSILSITFVYMVAPNSRIDDVLFWNATIVSVSIAYLAAYPLNYNLVKALKKNKVEEIG